MAVLADKVIKEAQKKKTIKETKRDWEKPKNKHEKPKQYKKIPIFLVQKLIIY